MLIVFAPLLIIAGLIGAAIARYVTRRTGSRHWGAVAFCFGVTVPWADAWVGVPYFYYWQRSHPSLAIYDTAAVDGYLRMDGEENGRSTVIPSPAAPYKYIEVRNLHIANRTIPKGYVSLAVVKAPDSRCIETTRDIQNWLSEWSESSTELNYCLRLSVSDEPVSRYALVRNSHEGAPSQRIHFGFARSVDWHRVSDGLIPIYGVNYQVVDRQTGRVLAEAWGAAYRPLLAMVIGIPVFEQRVGPLVDPLSTHPTSILIPR